MSPPSSCLIKPIFLLGSNHAQTPHLRPSLGLWGGGGGFGGSVDAGAAATAAGGSWPRVCAVTGAAGVTHCCACSLIPVATPRDGKSAAEKAGVSAGAARRDPAAVSSAAPPAPNSFFFANVRYPPAMLRHVGA